MPKPLTGGIAKQVYKAMKAAKMTLPATLIKVTPGTRTPGAASAGTNPTSTSYAGAGILDDFSAAEIDGTIIISGDRLVTLFGASIASGKVPLPDDKVTIGGATYRIISVQNDPANATYTCHARGAATP